MDDVLAIARDWGPWAGAVFAIAVAIRTYATSSAGTIRQLQTWLHEAQEELRKLRERVRLLEVDRDRLAFEVERLTPFEQRAVCLARELRELRNAITAGGAAQERAPRVPESASAEVVQLRPRSDGP